MHTETTACHGAPLPPLSELEATSPGRCPNAEAPRGAEAHPGLQGEGAAGRAVTRSATPQPRSVQNCAVLKGRAQRPSGVAAGEGRGHCSQPQALEAFCGPHPIRDTPPGPRPCLSHPTALGNRPALSLPPFHVRLFLCSPLSTSTFQGSPSVHASAPYTPARVPRAPPARNVQDGAYHRSPNLCLQPAPQPLRGGVRQPLDHTGTVGASCSASPGSTLAPPHPSPGPATASRSPRGRLGSDRERTSGSTRLLGARSGRCLRASSVALCTPRPDAQPCGGVCVAVC